MTIWVDAQISPVIAKWINIKYSSVQAHSVRSLNLLYATDREIFFAAKTANAVILTKDQDFYHLMSQFGAPPQIIWLTCGNTSTKNLCKLLELALPKAIDLLAEGERIVEIK